MSENRHVSTIEHAVDLRPVYKIEFVRGLYLSWFICRGLKKVKDTQYRFFKELSGNKF